MVRALAFSRPIAATSIQSAARAIATVAMANISKTKEENMSENWICNACRTPIHPSVAESRSVTLGSDAPTRCPHCGSDDGFSIARAKKPYEPPRVVESASFEGRALSCGKHGHCGPHANNS